MCVTLTVAKTIVKDNTKRNSELKGIIVYKQQFSQTR